MTLWGVTGFAQTHFSGDKTSWHGFDRYDFLMDETTLAIQPVKAQPDEGNGITHPVKGQRRCVVVVPRQAAPGNPWSWRGCYWDHQPQTEIALLNRGWCIAFIMPEPDTLWDVWYSFLTEQHGLSSKPAFIGMSKGGFNEFAWATAHPDKVSCIYADNPAISRESLTDLWKLARADVPLLHVCGSMDPILGDPSWVLNNTYQPLYGTRTIETVYRQLGGRISVMLKEGYGHHPHSLPDPTPIADFMVASFNAAAAPAANPAAPVATTVAVPAAPAWLPARVARSSYYDATTAYTHFPADDAYIACRGPWFTGSYTRYSFGLDSPRITVTVIAPATEAPGRPWVFRADHVDATEATVDLALLARGYHIVIGPVGTNADGVDPGEWDAVYRYLTRHGFSTRPVMEGVGGSAGDVYVWASAHPSDIACIYAENPLLHSRVARVQPLDALAPLARAGVPILHVCGSEDPFYKDNTLTGASRYKALGGHLRVIVASGRGHYPLGPVEVAPVVAFIEGAVAQHPAARPAAVHPGPHVVSGPVSVRAAALADSTPRPPFAHGQLMAGTAKVNLTPAGDEPLHDSIYARSLVLDVNGLRVAFVSVDLAVFTSERVEQVCKTRYGITQLWLCSSHNHSEPQKNGGRSFQQGNPYTTFYEDRIVQAVGDAVSNLFAARVVAGHRTFPQLGFNRLVIRDDGHARESWFGDDHYTSENPERIPFGPVDPEVGVIRIEDLRGQPRVLLMNYACHADVVCFNYAISADYPGVACRKVEEAFGGQVNCLFIQGAGGNVEPLMISSRRTGPNDPFQTDYRPMERTGELLADETLRLARSLKADPSANGTDLRLMDDSLDFTGRFNRDLHFDVHLSTLLIDSSIVIAACPGELFSTLQLDWKQKVALGGGNPFLFGYTWSGGRWPGYVADVRSAALGGYGADQDPGIIEVGAGERIVLRQLENYYRLNGLMREKPGPVGFTAGNRWIVTPVPPGKP
jgi:hypothetical protein